MGYHMNSSGRWAKTEPVTLAPSATRDDSSATGVEIELGDKGTLRLVATVTAKSGTDPTLDLTVETKGEDGTWYEAGTFAQFDDPTVPAAQRQVFAVDRWVRLKWEVGGTSSPDFTFEVKGEAA